MFNPLPPSELARLLGDVLRRSATWDRPLDEFETAQLLSSSSIARHLAAELAGGPAVLAAFCAGLMCDLDDVGDPGPGSAPDDTAPDTAWTRAVRRCRDELPDDDPRRVGGLLGELLDAGRGTPELDDLRPRLHRRLAELARAELAVLAGDRTTGGT